ncbi:hypothetical protein [Streptomyces flaveus]|uniref:hypothetical protein n=1 Tax=Streptomyces flaveus TaxID=66370 RepID=UPI0016716D28|nr:hypothetical protein [Streptomyces flaveus]
MISAFAELRYAVGPATGGISTLRHVVPALDAVDVTAEDTGPSCTPRVDGHDGGDQRPVGIRERAALRQGEATAGPDSRGDRTVRALLVPTSPTTPHHRSHGDLT